MLEFDFWKALFRILISLPIVLVLAILFIKFVITKKSFNFQQNYLQVIEQIGLSNKATLLVVKVGEEYFLYSATEHHVQMISKLPDYVPSQNQMHNSQTFTQILSRLNPKREADE